MTRSRRAPPSGSRSKRYMDAGELVPDDIVIGVVEERFATGGRSRTASSSTASPGPGCRRRSSSGSCSGIRSTWCSTSTSPPRSSTALRADASAQAAAPPTTSTRLRPSTGRATCAAAMSCSATTTPTRPSDAGSTLYEQSDQADHRLLREARKARGGQRRRRRRRDPGAPGQGRSTPVAHPTPSAAGDRPQVRRPRSRSMRRAGRVVAEMHDACIRAAEPGATTARFDPGAPGRCSNGGVPARTSSATTGSRRWCARRPTRSWCTASRATQCVLEAGDIVSHRLRGHRRGLARRRRDHGPGGRDRRRVPASDRGHPAVALEAPIRPVVAGGRLGDVGAAGRGASCRPPGSRWSRDYVRPRHRHRHARGARRCRTRARGAAA